MTHFSEMISIMAALPELQVARFEPLDSMLKTSSLSIRIYLADALKAFGSLNGSKRTTNRQMVAR